MKAAVIQKFADTPKYSDFPDPTPGKDYMIIDVKAAVLENFDKMTAEGMHYSSKHMFPKFPAIVGHSGVGTLPDGTLVAFGGVEPPYGTMAEKAAIPAKYKAFMQPIPAGVEPEVAAALPASALTSYFPLKYTAKLQPGETLLINGATGVSGKLALQIAKLLGAGKIVATGRNEATLKSLSALGADETVNLKQDDDALLDEFEKKAGDGYNVVIDFLWGHPAEILMKSFVPKVAGFAKNRIRYVHIGQKAGADIKLSGEMIRTSGLEIYGAGNISHEAIAEGVAKIWEWMKDRKLSIMIEKVPLADIANAWKRNDLEGKRIVIIP